MLNYESFPAQIRATAAIICYLIGGEGSGIAQPWMNKAAENIKITSLSQLLMDGQLQ